MTRHPLLMLVCLTFVPSISLTSYDRKLLSKRINMAQKDWGMTSERLSDTCHTNVIYLR